MKKLTILKKKGTKLSKKNMKKITAGRSWLYCFFNSGDYDTWADCRIE